MPRRKLAGLFATLSIALGLAYGCSSSGDYQGGGRLLVPPGGVPDGTVLGVDAQQGDSAVPDTNRPVDTGVDLGNPFG